MTYLNEIMKFKRAELKKRKSRIPLSALKSQLHSINETKGFKNSLSGEGIRIIAEIKKASPSKGVIREDFDHLDIAGSYERAGAAAISVLTDSNFFKGDIEYLGQISRHVDLPLLRKDFIFDEYQVFEARIYGADAILLIAAILDKNDLERLFEMSRALGMDTLVEVHDKKDLKKALSMGAEIIGVNNRDLKTFRTDISTTIELINGMPPGKVVVSESGINSKADIEYLKKGGADAFLIGEALMREADPGQKLKELIN